MQLDLGSYVRHSVKPRVYYGDFTLCTPVPTATYRVISDAARYYDAVDNELIARWIERLRQRTGR